MCAKLQSNQAELALFSYYQFSCDRMLKFLQISKLQFIQ